MGEQVAVLVVALVIYSAVAWRLPILRPEARVFYVPRSAREVRRLEREVARLRLMLETGGGTAAHEAIRQLQIQNQELREERARLEIQRAGARDQIAELEDEVAAAHGVGVTLGSMIVGEAHEIEVTVGGPEFARARAES